MPGSRGFLVPAGTDRPTRVPVADATCKAVGDDTGGAFTFLEYVMSRDVPAHVHAHEHETLYLLAGTVRVRVEDDEFTAGVGDFVFLPRSLPHSLAALSETPPRLLTVSSPSGFERFMEDRMEALAAGHDRSSPRSPRCTRSTVDSV